MRFGPRPGCLPCVSRATLCLVNVESYCSVSECEQPTRQGRIRCDFHEKRYQRGQSLTAPKQERLSPKERLLEAAYRFAESDAEDDVEYEQHARDLLKAARQLAPVAHGELVRRGMALAKAVGRAVGRRPVLTPQEAMALVKRDGSVSGAARARGVSRGTIRRALARGAKGYLSGQES